jgi:hypothetical protein
MASARQNVEIVERNLGVVLELSDEEADVLFYLVHRVSGDERRSPRRHTQAILEALRGTGRRINSPEYLSSEHYRNLERRCG